MIDLMANDTGRSANARALDAARKGAWVQVGPGRWALRRPGKLPGHVVCKVLANGDGTVRFEPLAEKMVKVTPGLTRALGLGVNAQTLHYLGKAEFVEILFPSPRLALLNLDSWMNHLGRVAADKKFWERTKNIEAYRSVLPAGVTCRAAGRKEAGHE
jgi:hypothetical protein